MSGWTFVRGPCVPALQLMADGCADLILTDPPYGTQTEHSLYGQRAPDGTRREIHGDEDLSELEQAAPAMLRALNPGGVALVFMAPSNRRAAEDVLTGAGFAAHGSLTWDKGRPGISYRIRYAYEDVILATHPDANPWEGRDPFVVPIRHHTGSQESYEHPNQKPVGLLRRYIRWALPDGGHVVDPFAGIASCGVAALLEGCSYTGMEIDPQWWPGAERRLNEASDNTHGLDLFDMGAA
jgi:DNA modification methylase